MKDDSGPISMLKVEASYQSWDPKLGGRDVEEEWFAAVDDI